MEYYELKESEVCRYYLSDDIKKSEEVITRSLESKKYFQNVLILPFDSPAPKGATVASKQETNTLNIYEIIEKSNNKAISGILQRADVPKLHLNNLQGILFFIAL